MCGKEKNATLRKVPRVELEKKVALKEKDEEKVGKMCVCVCVREREEECSTR